MGKKDNYYGPGGAYVNFSKLAMDQGVTTPFYALRRMEQEQRHEIADFLEIEFDEDSVDDPAGAEAWKIVNADHYGLQARTSEWYESLNPFATNSWRDILNAVAEALELDLPEHLDDGAVEAAIAEEVAELTLDQMEDDDVAQIDELMTLEPGFVERLRSTGLRPNTTKMVLSGVFQAAKAGGFGTYITAVQAAAWLNQTVGTKIAMRTATTALKTTLTAINVVLWVWLAVDILDFLFGSSAKKVAPVVAQIYVFNRLNTI